MTGPIARRERGRCGTMTTAGVAEPAPAVEPASEQEWRATCSRASVISGVIGLVVLALVVVANMTSWMDGLPGLATQFQIEGSGLGLLVGAFAAVVGVVTGFLGRKSRRRRAAVAGSWLSAVAFLGFAAAGFSLPYYPFVRGLAWAPDSTRIAYAQDQAGIWVVDADGSSEPTQLTASGESPDWSPDGTTIAYTEDWGGAIWMVSADGSSEPTQLVSSGGSPDWSPDGTTIAYVANVASGQEQGGELWVMDADGADPRQLTHLLSTQGAEVRSPSWSPVGTQLVLVGVPLVEGAESIWIVDADGGNLRRIADGFAPDWSPDGRRIVHATYPGGGPRNDYWVINADGTGRTQLPGEIWSDPQWTADGRLTFDCPEGMCVMDADGSDRAVLLAGSEGKPLAMESARVLSPDETRVAYATGAGIRSDIVVHTIDGSTQITLIR
ncbi:MAG: hypothetical protein WCF04_12550 [Candidatus Nanopelagicales bacterium]